jgi:uncharacterized protein (TIGR03437 family)
MKVSLLFLAVSLLARATTPVTLANFPNSTVYAVQTDAAGNIYVAGFQGNFSVADPFVAKLSPTGKTLYSTTIAGSNFGIAWSLAVDASGDAYVFGNTNSPDLPVTPGALQTASQGQFQGFVAKLDPAGKIVYCTYVGGATNVTPGLASAPGLNSILVDSAGDAIITGQAGTNTTIAAFPPAPAPVVSSSESFVLKLDPTGSKILGGISGVGGMIAMDGQGNVYVAGSQLGGQTTPLAPTTGAFQNLPANSCSSLGAFFTCGYQYVAKLNSALNQVLYATYLSGQYGATPTAVSVDAQGDVFVAGNTNSPDYPTTPNADEPDYVASATPPSCFFVLHCVNLSPNSGYISELNPTGTGLVYSSFFSGTQTDTINFATFTPSAVYLGGSASSPDLPGLTGYPQACLPQMYETSLSADGTEIGATRIAPGKVLAYDAAAGTLLATTGSNVIAVDPHAAVPPLACILDSADLKPVTSIAPGELVSLFGQFSTGSPAVPPAGQAPTSLGGITIGVNGVPSPLLYVAGEQINFQAPSAIAGAAQANLSFASTLSGLSESLTLPVVTSNPTAFLNTATPSAALSTCTTENAASVNGLLPLAFNSDGSVNTCLNPAAPGTSVSLILNGLGVTTAPTITATPQLTLASVVALPGAVSGIWDVTLQIPAGQAAGGVQVTLTANGLAVRDTNLVLWVN